ncbi:unnamed protein product [Cyprideis torosa]|uniref:Uncharacterized protein n=1 Tax=Cyprideis torosa TaxID=163714 RepID=A0A7R8ZQ48_9CRUS|nr:unnamed protein product [Cyprideis torosa]CAG0889832.1 unnamed protein product [Cyprideis torosa]
MLANAMADSNLESCLDLITHHLELVAKKPQRLLRDSTSSELRESFLSSAVVLHNNALNLCPNVIREIIPQLPDEGLPDVETNWQLLQLLNKSVVVDDDFVKDIATSLLNLEKVTIVEEDSELHREDGVFEDDSETDEEPEKHLVLEDSEERKVKEKKATSVVDDEFFHLSEMERFLDEEDKKYERGEDGEESDEDVDWFADEAEDQEEDRPIRYKDFFGPSSLPQEVGDESDEGLFPEDNESTGDDEAVFRQDKTDKKSKYELQEDNFRAQVEREEAENLAEKPWKYKGETSADNRPENALLEEDLEFIHNSRFAPVMTEEVTKTLEEIIKQRIKDKIYDDVERKIKPAEDPAEYKKRLVLDHEKSKLSLAQVYEKEYLEAQKARKDEALGEETEEVKAEHEVIRKSMDSLFKKLDALSNQHFVPLSKREPEVKIISNLPAVTREEVAPTTVSDAQLVAPQEVEDPLRGEFKGPEEESKEDKKRKRRLKKLKQRAKQQEKEKMAKMVNKLKPGLGNKYTKQKAMEEIKKAAREGLVKLAGAKDEDYSAKKGKRKIGSTSFFQQLHETQQLGTVTKRKKLNEDSNKKRVSASVVKSAS